MDIITPCYTRYANPDEVIDPSKMLEVTLIDCLRVKEIGLLISSFLIRETHDKFILVNTKFMAHESLDEVWYQFGAVVGVLLTGIISDLVLRDKRFLLLFIMNINLFAYDIYLFIVDSNPKSSKQISKSGSLFLGTIITGNSLLYLILIPMTLARRMQR